MYSREQLLEFHNEARQIKEHWWYDHNEPDLPPILMLRWRDMEAQTVDVSGLGYIIEKFRKVMINRGLHSWLTESDVSAPIVLWSALGAAADGVQLPGAENIPPKGTPLESIWLASEGYSSEEVSEEAMSNIQRGDLKRDFETNPASKVLERLMTYQVETGPLGTAEWGRVTSAFHKDDGGRIIWHEPIVNTSDEEDTGWDRLLEIMMPHVTREKLA